MVVYGKQFSSLVPRPLPLRKNPDDTAPGYEASSLGVKSLGHALDADCVGKLHKLLTLWCLFSTCPNYSEKIYIF